MVILIKYLEGSANESQMRRGKLPNLGTFRPLRSVSLLKTPDLAFLPDFGLTFTFLFGET